MNQPTAPERARGRSVLSRLRPAGALALVETDPRSWQQIATRLNQEGNARERRLRRALALGDAGAVAVALLVSVAILSEDALTGWALLLLPAVIAMAKLFGLYESDDQRIRKTTAEELPRLAQLGSLLTLGVWLADDALLRGGTASKSQAMLLGVVFVVTAVLARRTARATNSAKLGRERCLFIGDEYSYLRLRTIFARHQLTSDLVAHVPIRQGLIEGGADLAEESRALIEIIARAGAHRVIIGGRSFSNAMTFELLEAAREAGTRVSLLPDMLEVVGSSVDFDDLYGVTLLGVRHTQLSRSSRGLKRAFDVAGAAILLLAAAPLMALIAVVVKRDSPGPVLFRQWRVGRGGDPFRIFKFRTMVDGADAVKEQLRDLNEAHGLFKILDDPRITRTGYFLRRTSLDELPQLFNVLLGQMSLVGPRPLVADEDGRILGPLRGRLRLTPGMTGQWQISGSSRVPLEDMVQLDHLYVSNWTLWGDIKILLRTVPYVLARQGQ